MAKAAASGGRRLSRRMTTLLWIGGVTVAVIVLLYLERADVLYILSTLGVTALLFAVAQADLSGSRKIGPSGDDLNTVK
jgi:hypothetical protein